MTIHIVNKSLQLNILPWIVCLFARPINLEVVQCFLDWKNGEIGLTSHPNEVKILKSEEIRAPVDY